MGLQARVWHSDAGDRHVFWSVRCCCHDLTWLSFLPRFQLVREITKTCNQLSLSSLKRLAKKARLRWKRVRKSLKSLRDPAAFAKAKRELEALQKQEDQGQIALYYFDESGFALDPTIPYAWQEPKSVIELPARKYGRINV